jgi:6-pyruvoyltetrahydropterin/6-carboxytetrahydropterin synthase
MFFERKKMIRITKIFCFEAAHLLADYNGPCKNIHGHSYRLHVTIKGEPIKDESNPHDGMVIEFSVLKNIVNEHIVHPYDHAIILPERANKSLIKVINEIENKVVYTPFQPTCENLLSKFAKLLIEHLPKNVSLCKLKLYETANSYAEWCESDQTGN